MLMVRQFCCCLLILTAFGCQESTPVEAPPPPEPEPFVDPRAWTQPTLVDVIPREAQPYEPFITSISTGPTGDLHVLCNLSTDSLRLQFRFRLCYLAFDGVQWQFKGVIDGDGLFKPSTSVVTGPDQVHLFWAGVRAEHRQLWADNLIEVTDLYHCIWQGDACSEPVSLQALAFDRYPFVVFEEAVLDEAGSIHLLFFHAPLVYHLTMKADAQVDISTHFWGGPEPRVLAHDGVLYLAYIAAPPAGQGFNDLFYRMFKDGRWHEPVTVFHDVAKRAHVPGHVVDREGVHHIVWITEEPGASGNSQFSLDYAFSHDDGQTWSVPERLHTSDYLYTHAPKLIVDDYNVMHLTWGHLEVIPHRDNFYAAYRDGQWSQPKALFPEFNHLSSMLMALDNANRVHVLFQEDERLYHARFE